MRVVLQVIDGPEEGRKILLRSRHELRIGRTSWAEFVCEHDTKMSRVHFRIVTDSVGCYVEDLESSNGTFLNGEKIANERLKHNDQIRAGLTTFRIQIEGDKPDLSGSYTGPPPPAESGNQPRPGDPIRYSRKTCHSGLIQYTLAAEAVPPAKLAEQLSTIWPLFLMADFLRTASARPDDLQQADQIFDWLPAEVAAEYPVFFAQGDTEQTFDWIAEHYASDGLVCLFSTTSREQLLEHLRLTSRSRLHGADKSAGMLGICWPSVMSAMLPSGDAALIDRILTGINAVLLYPPAEPENGVLLGGEQIEQALQALGYQLDPASVENEQSDQAAED